MIIFNNNGQSRVLKAILFDMDGVVTDSMPWHYECWTKVLNQRNVFLEKEELYKREGEKGNISVMSIFEEKGINITQEECMKMLTEKEEMFRSIARVKLFGGIANFIHRISVSGTSVALVTGTSRGEMKRLLPESIQKEFCAIVTGDMLEHGKPDPDPYLKGLELLEVKAEDAIAIENSPLGILSAKRAGVYTIAVQTSLDEKYLDNADLIVPDHLALYNMFQN
jgi:beta-phosphoglucomutase